MTGQSINRRRLQWMLLLRVILVTTLLGSALTVQLIYSDAPAYRILYFFIGFTYLFTIFYGLFYKLLSQHVVYIYIQLIADAAMITILIYFTGGLESRYKLLYTIPIIAAAIMLSKKGALTLAIASFVLYGGLLNLLFYEVVYDPSGVTMRMIPLSTLIYDMFYHLFIFSLIALLIGYLSEAQLKTGRTLERTSVKLDDLIIFNRNVIDSMRSGLMTTDLNGWIISYNKVAEHTAMLLDKDIKNSKIHDFLEIGDKEFTGIRDQLFMDNLMSMEKVFEGKHGEESILSFSISTLPNSKGEVIGYIFSFLNVTNIRRLESELKLKDKMAALGAMAASIAHEIRNPLAAISGSAQELHSGSDLPEHDKALMDIIVKEVKRLNSTISHYLNYTQPHPHNPTDIDLKKMLEDTIVLLKKDPVFKKKIHILELNFKAASGKFIGDEYALKQVFWNIILNSMQAMEEKGKITITVESTAKPDEGVLLSFADEGEGIPDNIRDKVFQPFTTFQKNGTGLGLSIVYQIVQEHRGRITISGNTPSGTIVKIFLPLLEKKKLTGEKK